VPLGGEPESALNGILRPAKADVNHPQVPLLIGGRAGSAALEFELDQDSALLSRGLAANTSKRMLTTYPTATPINEQPIKATGGLRPKLLLTGDVTTTPRKPPARQANKRLCTVFLLLEPSVGPGWKALGIKVPAMSEVT
jgi:hypothetical protein